MQRYLKKIKSFLYIILCVILLKIFIIDVYKIPSESMLDTLQINDHILALKCAYKLNIPFVNKALIVWNKPKRGDIIVFTYPEDKTKNFIKRVIATEGEEIYIKDKTVYVNSKLLFESYKKIGPVNLPSPNPRDNWIEPITVPKGHYFVMGDNRDNSNDSRFWGPVSIDLIKAKAFFIYWPPWRIGLLK